MSPHSINKKKTLSFKSSAILNSLSYLDLKEYLPQAIWFSSDDGKSTQLAEIEIFQMMWSTYWG